jgi:hypothetical protein
VTCLYPFSSKNDLPIGEKVPQAEKSKGSPNLEVERCE